MKAHGFTLEMARGYFVGNRFTDEGPGGDETAWTAVAVETA